MSPRVLEAVVFDLDGVVTRTERVHFAAWKQLFDELLARRPRRPGEDHRPFEEADYKAHVDGKPRLEGVRAFLASRRIALASGDADTVESLGRRKNALFQELVERLGVEVDQAAVRLIQALRAAGIRVGMASSSRNAPALLRRAGLESLFDARVDGIASAELGLKGKPDPDIFVECARRLGASSPRQVAVLEDAPAGVAAGKAGGFGLVVGVDRGESWLGLREAGGDWIVRDLAELTADKLVRYFEGRQHVRPNALQEWGALSRAIRDRRLAVFLDYDGTLTPIVDRPELAVLGDGMRRTLRRVSGAWPTHLISGRGLEDVRHLAGMDSLWVAGSHGFDISPPRGVAGGKQVAPELEPEIHRAAGELRAGTAGIEGVLVEDKRFSLAVHYRLVAGASVPAVERAVDEVMARHPALRKSHGKKVFQVQPALDWDKGKALLWVMEATGQQESFPIYIGDDATDEDAFAVLAERGMGILVAELPRPTAARYALQDPFEVQVFLERLALLEREVRR